MTRKILSGFHTAICSRLVTVQPSVADAASTHTGLPPDACTSMVCIQPLAGTLTAIEPPRSLYSSSRTRGLSLSATPASRPWMSARVPR